MLGRPSPRTSKTPLTPPCACGCLLLARLPGLSAEGRSKRKQNLDDLEADQPASSCCLPVAQQRGRA